MHSRSLWLVKSLVPIISTLSESCLHFLSGGGRGIMKKIFTHLKRPLPKRYSLTLMAWVREYPKAQLAFACRLNILSVFKWYIKKYFFLSFQLTWVDCFGSLLHLLKDLKVRIYCQIALHLEPPWFESRLLLKLHDRVLLWMCTVLCPQ